MSTTFIKAAEGRLIFMPERGMQPVKDEPVSIELTPFYRKAIADGDVIECDEGGSALQVGDEAERAEQEAQDRAFYRQQVLDGVKSPFKTRAEAESAAKAEAESAAKADADKAAADKAAADKVSVDAAQASQKAAPKPVAVAASPSAATSASADPAAATTAK